MSFFSKTFAARDTEAALCVYGGDDSLLKGPLGYDVATAVYLRVLHDQKLVDTMAPDDYKAFVDGYEVQVMVTKGENKNILRVMVQLGNGRCIRGDELTDADFRKNETVLTVGCVKKGGKNYNFLLDDLDLQPVVHKYLLELWKEVWELDKDDPDFVDKLLELHWQYNPDEEKPQPKQPAKPQQPRPQQPATSASAGVQTGSNGETIIGDCYWYAPVKLKKEYERNKDNTGITDENDAILEAMAGNLMQATGIYLGVYGKENSESARQRKAAELVGFKEENIDILFGKKPKDSPDKGDSGKDDKKDANSKDDTDTEEFKFTPYRRCLGFASAPKMEEGELIELNIVREALSIVKSIVLDEDSSKLKMRRFARVWDVLQTVIDEASATGRNDVGNIYLHYKLGKINAFRLEFSYDGADYELMFGVDENK